MSDKEPIQDYSPSSSPVVAIEAMDQADWPAVRRIYVEGIETGNATFETEAPDWEKWDASHLQSCRLVARRDGEVLGWAALSTVSSRCVYAGVAEVSVYVAGQVRGQGIGSQLLARLIDDSEQAGIWTLQAGIFPENRASLKLHERCQFRIVGIRERLGCLQGRWHDVVLLERRSNVAGA
jgi:L-amino acid N-acyltransferase YncA